MKLADHWLGLPLLLRQRWWRETEYGAKPPGPGLVAEVNLAMMVSFLERMRDVATEAVLEHHAQVSLIRFPTIAGTADEDEMRADNETYRPYATRDAGAVIDALIAKAREGRP